MKRLKEDLSELRGKVSQKASDIAAYAAVLMVYFFIFDEGLKRPALTVIGSVAGAWLGVEVSILIAKALGKYPKK